MALRTIKQGNPITSLDKLAECEWIIVHGKPLHHGWFTSWPLRLAKRYLDTGAIFEGAKVVKSPPKEGGDTDDKVTAMPF